MGRPFTVELAVGMSIVTRTRDVNVAVTVVDAVT
jgi:hypothetical protein